MEDPSSPAVLEEAKLPPGTRLGKYEIIRLLGAGGMGAVYEARHTEMGKRVAIKTLAPALTEVPGARVRFLREAQLTSRVRHPHIVDVTDVGTDGFCTFLVMELLHGEDLSQRLARTGPLAPRELVDIILPVCSALVAAHEATIVHRDLKPQNIFLSTGPHGVQPKVLDFGISKSGDVASALTGSGAVIGTPFYLAPEQIQNARAAGSASDQYAIGVILYECLTGQRPFQGDSLFAVFQAIVTQRPRPLGERRADLPAGLPAIVERAMHAAPGERFPSMRALGHALVPFASPRAQAIWSDAFSAESEGDGTRKSAPRVSGSKTLPMPTPVRRVAQSLTPLPSSAKPPVGSRRRMWMLTIVGVAVLAAGGLALEFARGPHLGAKAKPAALATPPPLAGPVIPVHEPNLPPPAVVVPPAVVAPPRPEADPATKHHRTRSQRRLTDPIQAPEEPTPPSRGLNPNGSPVVD
jgi:serine/threonine protein kinase